MNKESPDVIDDRDDEQDRDSDRESDESVENDADDADDSDWVTEDEDEDEQDDDEIANEEIVVSKTTQDVQADCDNNSAIDIDAKVNPIKFAKYIHSVLEMIHPDLAISREGMKVVEKMVKDLFDHILKVAAQKACDAHCTTITSLHVQQAVIEAVDGELSKHAVAEGTKALVKYSMAYPEDMNGGTMSCMADMTSSHIHGRS